MIGAAIVFAVAVFLTRLIQNWLGSRFLPQTRLDAGVRNSVQTIVGYIGIIVAAMLAGAQIGLDVQKLALIAGGLSVGIGFGLQTIANNFVSGLILLWERTIRVGDLVVVGSDQGFVRAIKARATEIETFDRGSLIVPNSNFVSGVVKNWVHNDRVGRIIISVNVTYESDVDQVRDLMIAAAKAQEQVLAIPGPSVPFAEFGDWSLKFNLICFVDDIEQAERTRSDINFEVLRRMREAGLRIAYPAAPPADVPTTIPAGGEARSGRSGATEVGRDACQSRPEEPAQRASRRTRDFASSGAHWNILPGPACAGRLRTRSLGRLGKYISPARAHPPRLPADYRLLAREPPR